MTAETNCEAIPCPNAPNVLTDPGVLANPEAPTRPGALTRAGALPEDSDRRDAIGVCLAARPRTGATHEAASPEVRRLRRRLLNLILANHDARDQCRGRGLLTRAQ